MKNEKFNKFCIFYIKKFELIATINLLLVLIILICLLINSQKLIDFDICYIVFPCIIYFATLFGSYLILEKKQTKILKNKYINLNLKNEYKNFSYNPNGNFNFELFDFLNLKHYKKKIQDNIIGYYDDYKFNQNTVNIEIINKTATILSDVDNYESINIFDGIITEFKLKKSYKKILIYTNDLYFDLDNKNIESNIKIDDESFNNSFIINATNKNEALSFLNNEMITTLKHLGEKLLCTSFFIFIFKNKLFIGQNCSSNLFDPNFEKKENEQKIIKQYKEKMLYINNIINEFELDKEENDYY